MASDIGSLRAILEGDQRPLTPFRMLALVIFEDRPGWEDMLAQALHTDRSTLDAWMYGTAIIPMQALLTLRGMACGQMGAISHAVEQLDAGYGAIAQAECHGHA